MNQRLFMESLGMVNTGSSAVVLSLEAINHIVGVLARVGRID